MSGNTVWRRSADSTRRRLSMGTHKGRRLMLTRLKRAAFPVIDSPALRLPRLERLLEFPPFVLSLVCSLLLPLPQTLLMPAIAAASLGPGLALATALCWPLRVEADTVIGQPGQGGIITIRPSSNSVSKQQLQQFVGISGANSGAKALSLNRVVIPAGASAKAHRHIGSESAIYIIQGTVLTRYGEKLQYSIVNHAGDFLYIPAGLPHQPTNLSATEAAVAIVSRNDPNEQEHVELIEAVPHAHP